MACNLDFARSIGSALVLGALILPVACGVPAADRADASAIDAPTAEDSGDAARPSVRVQPIVVAYHAQARDAAVEILREGGSAADAFVAATLVEYVVAEGVTSLAGPLGVLVYDAGNDEYQFLDGTYVDAADPSGVFREGTAEGTAFLVPGAMSGLWRLAQRYGRLEFARLVEPARRIAEDGFALSPVYADMLAYRSDLLASTEYGRVTFLRDGRPLSTGDVLTQPVLADTLARIGIEGEDFFYRGEWATECVESVQTRGGRVTLEDLARYEARWSPAARFSYRGREIMSPPGRMYAAAWNRLALAILSQTSFESRPHPTMSADTLELLLRVARVSWELPWLFDPGVLDEPSAIASQLTDEQIAPLWARVSSELTAAPATRPGHHSYHLIVVDADGNVVSGTHTIASLPWGDGSFVRGIPLNASGRLTYEHVAPGERRLDATSTYMILDDAGRPEWTMGTFSASLVEASLQFLIDAIEYETSAEQAATLPRFGTFAPIAAPLTQWIDPAFSASVRDEVEARGLPLTSDLADTGLGAIVRIDPTDRSSTGGASPVPYYPDYGEGASRP